MSPAVPPDRKIVPLPELVELLRPRRAAGARLALTNGCFDLLHLGHVRYLSAASGLADLLVVGVNADASVRALKEPGRPLTPERARAEVLAALGCVDYVVLFDTPTAEHLVEQLRPDVYVKGGDYAGRVPPEARVARRLGCEFRLVELVPGTSTSELLRRIRESASA